MADLSFLEKFTKGDSSRMRRYINMYLQDSPNVFERMRLNIQEQKWKDLAINAHSIKPQCELMGSLELKNLLHYIEVEVKHNRFSEIETIYKKASAIHIESQISLRNLIQYDYSINKHE